MQWTWTFAEAFVRCRNCAAEVLSRSSRFVRNAPTKAGTPTADRRNLGAGGTSPLPGWSADSWGVGYYYLATSRVLRQTLGPVAPSGNEQGFELYYNAKITRWFTLSADIQAVDPAQFEAQSAFLLGLRAKIDF
jgi:porin